MTASPTHLRSPPGTPRLPAGSALSLEGVLPLEACVSMSPPGSSGPSRCTRMDSEPPTHTLKGEMKCRFKKEEAFRDSLALTLKKNKCCPCVRLKSSKITSLVLVCFYHRLHAIILASWLSVLDDQMGASFPSFRSYVVMLTACCYLLHDWEI